MKKQCNNLETDLQLDDFVRKMTVPTPEEIAFFEERKRKGLGVGLDENGNLIRETDRNKTDGHRR